RVRADANDRCRVAGLANEWRRTRPYLFRQVYAGGAMTACKVRRRQRIAKGSLAMSAQSSRAAVKPAFVKSGAAGAATFPGSDSRKNNYFEPKGRKATHYKEMTADVT